MNSRFQIQSRQRFGEAAGTAHEGIYFMGFPGGERHVRLPASAVESTDTCWTLTANLYSADGVMDLMLLTDALRRAAPVGAEIDLVMPYVPYARQDRVALPGEPLSSTVFCQLVNALRFRSVTIADPHSDVVPALLERVRIVPAADYVLKLCGGALRNVDQLALVAPDAGARKRVEVVAKALGAPVVYAGKKRDAASGRLSDAEVVGDIPDRPLLIVDDICDGGGTFIALAKVLRERTCQPLFLYVTHGLFTKGLEPLLELFDGVFTAHCALPELAHATSLTARSV